MELLSLEWDSDSFVLAVATLMSKDCSGIEWRYFALDPVVGHIFVKAARREATCKLSLVDSKRESLAIQRFHIPDFRINEVNWVRKGGYPTPSGFCPETRLCVLLKVVDVQDGHIRDLHYLFSKPRLAFMAPVVFGANYFLAYVPGFSVSRKVTLSLDELKRVATVTCELSFAAANAQRGE